jgi:hypothetical protein
MFGTLRRRRNRQIARCVTAEALISHVPVPRYPLPDKRTEDKLQRLKSRALRGPGLDLQGNQ